MSDRAAAQKSFNDLLASYRADILPHVIHNWDSISTTEQSTLSHMHHFYCAMHLVVNMAEHSSESLKLTERNYDQPTTHSIYVTNEPGSIRLIRTACKAFERRGDEKSGCPLQFLAYLKKNGISKNPLIHFRGNRFNVVFANGARIFYLHEHIGNFLKLWGTPNRLLQAVLEDVNNPINISGTKALGLIDKHITGPLWRIIESADTHVLDIPKYYKSLKEFTDKCTEANIGLFMTGEDIPFDRELVKRDDVWLHLVSPSSYDSVAGNMLLSIFKAFSLLLDRVLTDLHSVIQAEEKNRQDIRAETASAKTTNTISERDFAKLDRLLREKPHASTLALEAHILFTNNKTSKWFNQKSATDRSKMMEEARKNAPHYRKLYHQRISEIEENIIKQQCEREKKNKETERKLLLAREKITSEMINYGLWQSIDQVDSNLTGMSETQKRSALKAQLRFRKTVLQQQAPEESVYKFSLKEKGQLNSKLLRDNLVKLVQAVNGNETSDSALVGKAIKHRFQESNGKHKFYKGKVISQVPGFPEWFNLVYTNEPGVVYSYKLSEDIENGDLQVL